VLYDEARGGKAMSTAQESKIRGIFDYPVTRLLFAQDMRVRDVERMLKTSVPVRIKLPEIGADEYAILKSTGVMMFQRR
jgi:hypothetical protein